MKFVNANEVPPHRTGVIKLHSADDFEGMRKAGRLAAEVLDYVSELVKPGVSTGELNDKCHTFIMDHGAVPAPLNYRGFPKSICTSVNHVICHGIPGDKKLKEGDSLNIDVTVILDGWYGDTSRMFFVGQPRKIAERLCDVTFESMWRGIKTVKPGTTLGDIGAAIQDYAEGFRYSVVRDFCGHGIGRVFHDEPSVLHYGRSGEGLALRPGMFFTIEPMINAGRPDAKILADGWTAVTRDKSLSMQFEHTIGVTEDGFEVFTKSPKGLDKPPYA